MEITLQLRCILVCQLTVSFSTSELNESLAMTLFMTLGLRFFVVRLHYLWK